MRKKNRRKEATCCIPKGLELQHFLVASPLHSLHPFFPPARFKKSSWFQGFVRDLRWHACHRCRIAATKLHKCWNERAPQNSIEKKSPDKDEEKGKRRTRRKKLKMKMKKKQRKKTHQEGTVSWPMYPIDWAISPFRGESILSSNECRNRAGLVSNESEKAKVENVGTQLWPLHTNRVFPQVYVRQPEAKMHPFRGRTLWFSNCQVGRLSSLSSVCLATSLASCVRGHGFLSTG